MTIEQQLDSFIVGSRTIDEIYRFSELIRCKYGTIERKARLLTHRGVIEPITNGKAIIGYKRKNSVVAINTEPRPQNAPQAIVVPNLPLKKVNKTCKYWDREKFKCSIKKECERCFLNSCG